MPNRNAPGCVLLLLGSALVVVAVVVAVLQAGRAERFSDWVFWGAVVLAGLGAGLGRVGLGRWIRARGGLHVPSWLGFVILFAILFLFLGYVLFNALSPDR